MILGLKWWQHPQDGSSQQIIQLTKGHLQIIDSAATYFQFKILI